MLTSLTINDVVLIDRLTVEFRPGFCALTGETGAGKSILLDSLGLALGSRSESGLVRRGAEQASVTAMFDLPPDHPAFALAREQTLDIAAGEPLILRRTVSTDGRSRAFVNDQAVSVALLRTLGETLVEIHGQFDTHGLLDPKTHRTLLDDYARIGRALPPLWEAWRAARTALEAANEESRRARTEEDYLRQAVDDLDALSPREGEESELAGLRERLMNREQVLQGLNGAFSLLSDEGGAEQSVNQAWRALERIAAKAGEDDIGPILTSLDAVAAQLQDVVARIEALSAALEESDHDLQSVDDRLFALRAQARKHGCMTDDLPSVLTSLTEKLALIDRAGDVIGALEQKADAARTAFLAAAETVSRERAEAAARLDRLVAAELPPLKLDKARFVTVIERLPEADWGPDGVDSVRFLVATNPGSEPGPLNKIASGGEMARFMLALKVVMAETGAAQTLVFDEVDTGIGGATADAVGERLARLAARRQIMVVTHSPQVAARAGHHWIVMKGEGAGAVRTTVIPLSGKAERQEEIARMLSGSAITPEARAAAQKLLETGT